MKSVLSVGYKHEIPAPKHQFTSVETDVFQVVSIADQDGDAISGSIDACLNRGLICRNMDDLRLANLSNEK